MKRVLVGIFLWLALLAGQALAQPVECDNHSLRINLMPGEVGQTLTQDNFRGLSADFMAMIDSVNANKSRLVVEVSNDSTKWRMLRLMAQDSRYKGVDFKTMNLVFDAALNVARRQAVEQFLVWLGVSPNAIIEYRPMRDEKRCFVEMRSAPLLAYQQLRIVERPAEKSVAPFVLPKFVMPKLPKLGLALHGGVTSTWENVAPMATLSLRYNNSVVQAYGFYSLFVPREEKALGQDREVYDQGVGLLVGQQIGRPLWLMIGYERQEIVLDDRGDQSSKNIFWFQGGELGLMWLDDNHFVTLTGLYGHRKEWRSDWSQILETDAGVRLAVGVRFFGGK